MSRPLLPLANWLRKWRSLERLAPENARTGCLALMKVYEKLPRNARSDTYAFLARQITAKLWKGDPEAALRWASSLDHPDEQSGAMEAIEHAVFYQQSPVAAAVLLREHPNDAALGAIAERFAKDYAGADGMKWARELPPAHGERLTRKLFEYWAGGSAQTAAEYLQSGAVPDHLRSTAVSAFARKRFGDSPGQAAEWARESLASSTDPEADRLAIARAIRVAEIPEPEAQKAAALREIRLRQ